MNASRRSFGHLLDGTCSPAVPPDLNERQTSSTPAANISDSTNGTSLLLVLHHHPGNTNFTPITCLYGFAHTNSTPIPHQSLSIRVRPRPRQARAPKPGCRARPDTCPAERAVREGQYLVAGDGVLPKAGHAMELLARLFADGAFPLTAESRRSRRSMPTSGPLRRLAIRAMSLWKQAARPVCLRRPVQTTSGDGDAGGSEAVSQSAFALRAAVGEQDPQRETFVVFVRLAHKASSPTAS